MTQGHTERGRCDTRSDLLKESLEELEEEGGEVS